MARRRTRADEDWDVFIFCALALMGLMGVVGEAWPLAALGLGRFRPLDAKLVTAYC